MRLWTLHPKYLDSKGLVAVWREALLAKNVLEVKTKGYKNHPQLNRFKAHKKPLDAINFYLQEIYKESQYRNYNFSKDKFIPVENIDKISVTSGQIEYELNHMINKLEQRDQKRLAELKSKKEITLHTLFNQVTGNIESWEKITNRQ